MAKKSHIKKDIIFSLITLFFLSAVSCTKKTEMPEMEWQPVEGRIMTRWAKDVSPADVHPDYPRPQMIRKEWMGLNGLWEYAIRPEAESAPEQYDGTILVPFPVESALSGVQKPVGKQNRLWYRRIFNPPKGLSEKRILLHFEAVDWETTVWINGQELGTHRGGYDPITFDITDFLEKRGPQEIVLSVWDPANEGFQPRGKQVKEPGGIWYTSVTGIWRSVWLEPVNQTHIQSFRIVADIDAEEVRISVSCADKTLGYQTEIEVREEGTMKGMGQGVAGEEISILIENPRMWSPDSPFLYDLTIVLKDSQGSEIDHVESYFGMRKISLGKDDEGVTRLFLNNKPLFMIGPLDQGWWPDGLYTAPTDEALRYDLEITKKLGMNMLRKHVKIEPRRFYYWCDKLGVLIWQDMPNGDAHIGKQAQDIERSTESAWQFELELEGMIQTLFNHPCIAMWVPFNEGWGQYDTARIVERIKELDPTRLVNNASGWADRGVGDVHDIHSYPGPDAPPSELHRAAVLGEFGGLGLMKRTGDTAVLKILKS